MTAVAKPIACNSRHILTWIPGKWNKRKNLHFITRKVAFYIVSLLRMSQENDRISEKNKKNIFQLIVVCILFDTNRYTTTTNTGELSRWTTIRENTQNRWKETVNLSKWNFRIAEIINKRKIKIVCSDNKWKTVGHATTLFISRLTNLCFFFNFSSTELSY